MIDYEKSAELNGMEVEELKAWFKKYPGSGKRIIRICDNCGEELNIPFQDYCDLCRKCENGTFDHRTLNSKRRKEQCSDIEYRKVMSKTKIQFYKDNPEVLDRISKNRIEYWSVQDNRNEQSDRMKNSDASKIANKITTENQRGGLDIINHHWLYDDADLSKYTMPMTRSEHTAMHNRMRADRYEVPHINSKTDDNGLWGYH